MGIDKSFSSTETLLYQTGYLTIKSYDRDLKLYNIGLPNDEVKSGFLKLFFSTRPAAKSISLSSNLTNPPKRQCGRSTTAIMTLPTRPTVAR